LFIEGYMLPDPFYWDLWGKLEQLRNTYADYCADEHFDPEASEEEESWHPSTPKLSLVTY
jgi:hypothetical protein